MNIYHLRIIFLIGLAGIIRDAGAQEIKGDTIFVNAEAEVQVEFPVLPNYFNTVPSNAPYSFKTAGKGFTVIAKSENTKPAPLSVAEGGRNHHFILAFRKNINYSNESELYYNYSDLKKLADHVKEMDARRTAQPEVKAPEIKSDNEVKTDPAPAAPSVDRASEQAKNDRYIAFTSQAKADLDLKKYADAREGFRLALELRPGDLYCIHQIEKIDRLIQEETGQKQQKELKDLYNGYMNAGDQALSQNLLADARKAYEQALAVMKNDPVATNRLRQIEEKEKQRKAAEELENNYNAAIQEADRLFQAGDYTNAKQQYIKANGFIKKVWADEQIKKINEIQSDQLAREKADKENAVKLAAINARYLSVIGQADIEFDKSNYPKARKLYIEGSTLKPSEQHPKERLLIIQNTLDRIASEEKARKDSIAAAAIKKKKYDAVLSKAKSYYQKDDLVNARDTYLEAASLNPSEPEPKKQLGIINARLEEIAKIKETDEKYEAKIASADSALIAKSYELSMALYNEALAIKPSETYPAKQIRFIQVQLKNQQTEKLNADIREAERLTKLADKSVADKDFESAEQQYMDVLKLQPANSYVIRRLEIVRDQLKKTRIPIIPVKQSNSRNKLQTEPLPYTAEELKNKYPGIDLTKLPDEQRLNPVVDAKLNATALNKVLADKPGFDISDKENKVKLTCQNINFDAGYVFLKLCVQNNADKDFLTGPMMLTWTKKLGNNIKLSPVYLYPATLPVVQPGNEVMMIYVFNWYKIENEDKLKFELSDRMNKTKLELNFSGLAYNHKSMR